MRPEIKAKWVAALRSGEYKQAQGQLRTDAGFCCLGVLCELHRKEVDGSWVDDTYQDMTDDLPNEVREWSGLHDPKTKITIGGERTFPESHNDAWGVKKKSFLQIADAIEAQL